MKGYLFAAFSVLIGLVIGLGSCELLIRIFHTPNNQKPRIPLGYGQFSADCYSTNAARGFPIDLNEAAGLSEFISHFPEFSVYDGNLAASIRRSIHSGKYRTALLYLMGEAPYCVLYDHTVGSPRKIYNPEKFSSTIALIGDSFAYGQGVDERSTYAYFLSRNSKARIINYANIGANIQEISVQFQIAMADVRKYDLKKIIYLFVLNDPLLAPGLEEKQSYINDLMNYRQQNIGRHTGIFSESMTHSRLLSFFMERWIVLRATKETIQWYKDIYSQENAANLAETFRIIQSMKDAANSRGVKFYLVVYPLMAGFGDYPLGPVHAKIMELATSYGIEALDLLAAFRAHAGKDFTVHPVDFHPNRIAHQIAAEATSRIIR